MPETDIITRENVKKYEKLADSFAYLRGGGGGRFVAQPGTYYEETRFL